MHARESERGGNNHPVRYLLLTKHAPHPRQIGRIAERINTMGTMRLFALKDWAAVRNADPYIRILGQELDQITETVGQRPEPHQHAEHARRYQGRTRSTSRRTAAETLGLSARWTCRRSSSRLAKIMPRYIPANPAKSAYRLVLRDQVYR